MRVDYNDISVFLMVAHEGSFVAASRRLGLPTSTVSRRIGELETRLGAQLLRRTTRSVSLTDDGTSPPATRRWLRSSTRATWHSTG
jgi:DNA-binding transcriptional LysR family regulator